MKKLTIITVNLNNAAGLEKTIKSVTNQTFKAIEYIVMDGGSTDESVAIIKKYAAKITYWKSEKDKGVYNAMNKGIERAEGEYCLFLNSGDYLADEKVVERVFNTNFTEAILYGNMLIDGGNGKIKLAKMPPEISRYQMYTDTLWHPVSFIKRELFQQFGNYDERYKIVADYEFFFRVIIAGKVSTRHLKQTITVFPFNGLSSDPANITVIKAEREQVIKTYLTEVEIQQEEAQLKEDTIKRSRLINRLINKFKR